MAGMAGPWACRPWAGLRPGHGEACLLPTARPGVWANSPCLPHLGSWELGHSSTGANGGEMGHHGVSRLGWGNVPLGARPQLQVQLNGWGPPVSSLEIRGVTTNKACSPSLHAPAPIMGTTANKVFASVVVGIVQFKACLQYH